MMDTRFDKQHEATPILRWWLTERRTELGYSWEDVARLANTVPFKVREWAEGRGAPSPDQLLSLARHLRSSTHPPGAEPLLNASVEKHAFVVAPNGLGIGKCIEIDGETATVEYFDTVAERTRRTVPVDDLRVVRLSHQTRCYVEDVERERWRMGRIERLADGDRIVAFPGLESERIDQENLYVRWAKPVEDPIETLKQKGQETVFFRNRREPFIRALLRQRTAARGASGLLSSSIDLYPHQVEVVRRVLEDPIQRYLLADEVGLGKTIEAGIVIRQFLLDHGGGYVCIFAPPALCAQWRREMDEKFDVAALEGRVAVFGIDELSEVAEEEAPDFLVIDEAHRVANWAFSEENQPRFNRVASLAHAAERLLLLSATPAHRHEEEYLAMLHLLDPQLYSLDDVESFRARIRKRTEIGDLLRDLVEGEDPFPLELAIEDLRTHFPDDPDLNARADELYAVITSDPLDEERRDEVIRELRLHLKERYRLHHRMLRSRRSEASAHIDTGRTAPQHGEFGLDERERRVHELLETWRLRALRAVDDESAEGVENDYVRIFQHLVETAGSSLRLLADVVRLRIDATTSDRLERDFSGDDIARLAEAPLFPGEADVLDSMVQVAESEVDEYDVDHAGWLEMFLERHLASGEDSDTFVVFTNYPSVAAALRDRLEDVLGAATVAGHLTGMTPERSEANVRRFREDASCRILICDPSGEEGRNFQFATHLVHYDLPWAPNRIEQRIGRLDRIGRKGRPMQTHVYLGPEDAEETLFEAWYMVLADGFNVFDESIASLQFLAEDLQPALAQDLFRDGTSRLDERIGELKAQIEDEQQKLARQREFEELDALREGAQAYFNQLEELESRSDALYTSMDAWITRALRFHRSRSDYPDGMIRYEPNFHGNTLVPFDAILNGFLPRSEKPTTYHRSIAVDSARSLGQAATMFRLGHPFLNTLVDYFEWDDRGRAYAIWRTNQAWQAAGMEDALFFRFEFVVEADVDHAAGEANRGRRAALQRRADAYFPPRFKTVFTNREGAVVTNEGIRLLLEPAPKRRQSGGNDENVKGDRLHVLDRFIDPLHWGDRCQNARDAAERALLSDSDLQQHVEAGRYRAQQDGRDRIARLELRAEAPESSSRHRQIYANLVQRERHVSEALCRGIETPAVRLDSVGVVILSGNALPRDER